MTTAVTMYKLMSLICRPAKALGKSSGFFISLMKLKNAMCPAYAKQMFIALENAVAKSVVTVASTFRPGFSIATAMSVMKTAPTMEMKAAGVRSLTVCHERNVLTDYGHVGYLL